jgi:hypothetical protein
MAWVNLDRGLAFALAGLDLVAGVTGGLRLTPPLFDDQHEQENAENGETGRIWQYLIHQMK